MRTIRDLIGILTSVITISLGFVRSSINDPFLPTILVLFKRLLGCPQAYPLALITIGRQIDRCQVEAREAQQMIGRLDCFLAPDWSSKWVRSPQSVVCP